MSVLFRQRKIKKFVKQFIPKRYLIKLGQLLRFPEKMHYQMAAANILKSNNHRRILSFKNKHIGDKCFVIGSGSSIRNMDLTQLKDEITFGFNSFYLISDALGFMPTYYLIEDSLPAEDNCTVINELKDTTKIFPKDLSYCLKPDQNTIYVHMDRYYSDFSRSDFPRFSEDALRCVYWGGTVAFMALQMAYYMGIREVYLLGIDLDYKLSVDESTVGDGEVITTYGEDDNHFHPMYFGNGKRWHYPNVERMQKSFEHVWKHFNVNGRKVFNAGIGGNLKTIPRVNYNDIFKDQN